MLILSQRKRNLSKGGLDVTINFKLRGIRAGFGLTQAQLAEKLSLSKNAYNFKERGVRYFTQSEMENIRIIFDLNPEQFMEIFFASDVNAKETIAVNK